MIAPRYTAGSTKIVLPKATFSNALCTFSASLSEKFVYASANLSGGPVSFKVSFFLVDIAPTCSFSD